MLFLVKNDVVSNVVKKETFELHHFFRGLTKHYVIRARTIVELSAGYKPLPSHL
jgi:hypothetical protein